ncbi:RNA polymerase sigma factor [Chitinophaga lutea]
MGVYQAYTDAELMQLLKHSDEAAFTEVYHRYWRLLFAVAVNKLGDLTLAEDLVQDVFADIWNRREMIELNGSLRAYLAVAVKYKVIDARHRRSVNDQHERNAAARHPQADESLERQVHFEDLRDKLAQFVAELPEKARLVYQLSREGGYAHRQIAERLQTSEKNVEYHLYRALRILRIRIGQIFFSLLLGICLAAPTL